MLRGEGSIRMHSNPISRGGVTKLVIRIVVLSTEKDSWVSCWLDEIRVTWVNQEEIRFVRFWGGIGDLRNNRGSVESGFVSMRLMHQGS